ncbi:MAG: hypothetical protein AB1489_31300 [Acidobacteriota bacterium]
MKYTEIQWMPFAPGEKQWWVFEHEVDDEIYSSDMLDHWQANSYHSTGRLVGQFATVEAALAVYPQARLSSKAKEALQELKN